MDVSTSAPARTGAERSASAERGSTVWHFPFCPGSRAIRLAMAELGLSFELEEERVWEWRAGFVAMNPAGELPVVALADGSVLSGLYAISEYLDEACDAAAGKAGFALFPGAPIERAEVRRLVDWFHGKMSRDVTREALAEKLYSRIVPDALAAPDPGVLIAVRENLRYHLTYISHLADERNWLAGDELSFADLVAGAHLSVLDYLGEIAWDRHPVAKSWYQRLKSRPSFRPLLADRIAGMSPPACYADLDF
jgi:glutathione S-transferase